MRHFESIHLPTHFYLITLSVFLSARSQSPLLRQDVELFSIDSNDESNVALFHPQPTAAAQLGFLYATKDGRIRAFCFGR